MTGGQLQGADDRPVISHHAGMDDTPEFSPDNHVTTRYHLGARIDVSDEADMPCVADRLSRAKGASYDNAHKLFEGDCFWRIDCW